MQRNGRSDNHSIIPNRMAIDALANVTPNANIEVFIVNYLEYT